jgi:hypothetical protein
MPSLSSSDAFSLLAVVALPTDRRFMRTYTQPTASAASSGKGSAKIQQDFLDAVTGTSVVECPVALQQYHDQEVSQPTPLLELEKKELARRDQVRGGTGREGRRGEAWWWLLIAWQKGVSIGIGV